MPQLEFLVHYVLVVIQQQKLIEAKLAGGSERTCKSLARDNEDHCDVTVLRDFCFSLSSTAVKRCSSGSDVTLALMAFTSREPVASWGMLFDI